MGWSGGGVGVDFLAAFVLLTRRTGGGNAIPEAGRPLMGAEKLEGVCSHGAATNRCLVVRGPASKGGSVVAVVAGESLLLGRG